MSSIIQTTINPGSVITTSTSTSCTIADNNITYYCLGEEIIVKNSFSDKELAIYLSLITMLGIGLYAELKKNNISFYGSVKDFLEIKYKAWLREKKIDDILND